MSDKQIWTYLLSATDNAYAVIGSWIIRARIIHEADESDKDGRRVAANEIREKSK